MRFRTSFSDTSSPIQGELVASLPAGAYESFHDDQGFHVELAGVEVMLVGGGGKFECRKRSDGTVDIFKIGASLSTFERQKPLSVGDTWPATAKSLANLNTANRAAWGDSRPVPRSIKTLADLNRCFRVFYSR